MYIQLATNRICQSISIFKHAFRQKTYFRATYYTSGYQVPLKLARFEKSKYTDFGLKKKTQQFIVKPACDQLSVVVTFRMNSCTYTCLKELNNLVYVFTMTGRCVSSKYQVRRSKVKATLVRFTIDLVRSVSRR